MFCQSAAALNNAKNMYCHTIEGGCTKWQNLIFHYLTDIASNLILMQFISPQICEQHNYI
jgi:hypothetical protein